MPDYGWRKFFATTWCQPRAEAIIALDLRADLLQGFYFTRPHKIECYDEIQYDLNRVQNTGAKFKSYTLDKIKATQIQDEERLAITKYIAAQIEGIGAESFEGKLTELIGFYAIVQSACVLDESGIQISETVLNPQEVQQQKPIIFRPPSKDTDHSLKEYYYVLMEAQIDPFATKPYVLPLGRLCVTVSISFKGANSKTFFYVCI